MQLRRRRRRRVCGFPRGQPDAARHQIHHLAGCVLEDFSSLCHAPQHLALLLAHGFQTGLCHLLISEMREEPIELFYSKCLQLAECFAVVVAAAVAVVAAAAVVVAAAVAAVVAGWWWWLWCCRVEPVSELSAATPEATPSGHLSRPFPSSSGMLRIRAVHSCTSRSQACHRAPAVRQSLCSRGCHEALA